MTSGFHDDRGNQGPRLPRAPRCSVFWSRRLNYDVTESFYDVTMGLNLLRSAIGRGLFGGGSFSPDLRVASTAAKGALEAGHGGVAREPVGTAPAAEVGVVGVKGPHRCRRWGFRWGPGRAKSEVPRQKRRSVVKRLTWKRNKEQVIINWQVMC